VLCRQKLNFEQIVLLCTVNPACTQRKNAPLIHSSLFFAQLRIILCPQIRHDAHHGPDLRMCDAIGVVHLTDGIIRQFAVRLYRADSHEVIHC